MKESLKPGLKHQHSFVVPRTKTVAALYPESERFQEMPEVFATGFMVGLLEWACLELALPHLDHALVEIERGGAERKVEVKQGRAGVLTLVGTRPDRMVAALDSLLGDPGAHRVDPSDNPYGDGHAARRIVAALEYLAGVGPAPERFGPSFSRRDVLEAAGYPYGMFSTPLAERGLQPDRTEESDGWVGR